ncbi:MAG: GPW/gp25 family protein [Pseudomonadota bacterium]|nr:GPW/gp25 family protein [Pseudomonadota bacterium]
MADFDRHTGEPIDNYRSALQSVEVIFTTYLGEEVMLREFGAGLIELLGRRMTPLLFLIFRTLIKASIDAWEPRFVVRRVLVNGDADNLRLGEARFMIEVDWRPGAHLVPPDRNVAGTRTFGLGFYDRGVAIGVGV